MHYQQLANDIKSWGQALGFQQVGITDVELTQAEQRLQDWLTRGFAGSMDYMHKHHSKRTRPSELLPGTVRVIAARINYQPETTKPKLLLQNTHKAYIARYALGRDYHKIIRKKLKQLAEKISAALPEHRYRVFVDSAPVMEKPLAAKAGLGWQGKNTLLLNQQAGSYFFLGMIYTNLPLPVDEPLTDHCNTCRACLNVCPTQAIIAPYQLDARRCISYLTIEYKGSIPVELRKKIGNRVFGCDDCQIICPWNRYASMPSEPDFRPRQHWQNAELIDLFSWTEEEFLSKTTGSAIRRATYLGWLRNIAVALGNAKTDNAIIQALKTRQSHESALVREHVAWALAQHGG